MNSGCITGATLLIGNASRTAVGYYIPSVVFVNDTMEMPVNETLLYCKYLIVFGMLHFCTCTSL